MSFLKGVGLSRPNALSGMLPANYKNGIRLPFNLRTIGEGDSIFSYVDGRSILQWANIMLDGRMKFSPNGVAATDANSGHEWNLIDATVATLISEHAPLDLVLLDGGTNDTNVTTPFSDALVDAEHMIDALNDNGTFVVYMEIPPRFDANAAGKAANQATNNNTIRGWESSKDLKTFSVDDVWIEADLDATDKVHQKTQAAYKAAQKLFALLDPIIEKGDVRAALAANKCTNPTFTPDTGGTIASGMGGGSVIPSGWTVDNDTGATVVSSVITRDDGTKAIRLDVSGTASSDSLDLRIFQVITDTYVTNDCYEFVADLLIKGAGGTGDPVGINGWALIGGNAVTFTQSQAAALGGMNFQVDNTVRCCSRPYGSGSTSFSAGVYFRFAIGAVSARIEFALPHCADYQ